MVLQGEKELSFANYSYYNYSIGISQLTKQIKTKICLEDLIKVLLNILYEEKCHA